MKEDFLQYIWANTLYKTNEFITSTHKKIKILNPGMRNTDAGPDFFNSRLEINGMSVAGNVEIHLKSSDWYKHGHHDNPAYNNVILSVVKEDDVKIYNQKGNEVDCIQLKNMDNLYNTYLYICNSVKWPGCMSRPDLLDNSWLNLNLQGLAIERLERKVNDICLIKSEISNDWQESFFRLLCKYWSGSVNSEAFFQLAFRVPYKLLLKHSESILSLEALLFGCSGLLEMSKDDDYTKPLKEEFRYLKTKYNLESMEAYQWKFMRIRPDAFPTIRISLLAAFIHKAGNIISLLPEMESIKDVRNCLNAEASPYWNNHYIFNQSSSFRVKHLGKALQDTIMINAVIPFTFIYGKERGDETLTEKAIDWLEQIEKENNFIVRAWENYGFVFDSALQSQALIQLHREYCEKRRCLSCRIGREVLKMSYN